MAFTVRDLPLEERPRERLQAHGAQALSMQELLAIVLGRGISGESVLNTAQRILTTFSPLSNLSIASLEDLQVIKGIGKAKACQLLACFEIARRMYTQRNGQAVVHGRRVSRPADVADLVKNKITHFAKEHFFVISFDTRNQFIALDIISVGTINASLVHPREVFDMAIHRHAVHIILCHNHPSGACDPSDEDVKLTRRLISAGELLGISVLDHLIVSKDSYCSLKEAGYI
ncbi:DNA repair protein RadC [Candidatus Roizmanbacteria bacterium]|nr:DNA repair protein RadC [Candidatus Roizmanbacteria bacterium]